MRRRPGYLLVVIASFPAAWLHREKFEQRKKNEKRKTYLSSHFYPVPRSPTAPVCVVVQAIFVSSVESSLNKEKKNEKRKTKNIPLVSLLSRLLFSHCSCMRRHPGYLHIIITSFPAAWLQYQKRVPESKRVFRIQIPFPIASRRKGTAVIVVDVTLAALSTETCSHRQYRSNTMLTTHLVVASTKNTIQLNAFLESRS